MCEINIDLNSLNESQRNAVLCIDAPMLVIAGAGSGKTRVLTYKIAYLISQGYHPTQILALTFTNKAANEMKQRIAQQVGDERANYLWMGTFHSIFSRILRIEAAHIGFQANYTIYDASDAKALVESIIREMQLDDKQYKPSAISAKISRAKNELITAEEYGTHTELVTQDQMQRTPLFGEIYRQYMLRCRKSNAMDFDDILLYTWMLFRDNPDIRDHYQQRFRYVLVDEYQDTNNAQHRIIYQLTSQHQHLCVVGDDAQSIYSFRGASILNILSFQELYQGVQLFKLEQNYRSTQNIVRAANSLIHHNQRQIFKEAYSKNSEGSLIEVYKAYSDVDEANLIVRKLQQLTHSLHTSYGEMALLYRTNAQSRSLEEALRRAMIPYRIVGSTSFYQRAEVKDFIAYCRLAVNPNDEVSFLRVVNKPVRGIGKTTVERFLLYVKENDTSIWEALSSADSSLGVTPSASRRLRDFALMIQSFHEQVPTTDAYTLAMHLVQESGMYKDIFSSTKPTDEARKQNLQELLDSIHGFVQERVEEGNNVCLSDYLQVVSLLADNEENDVEERDRVSLMTVHASKGLEFDVVVVTGLEENLFPSTLYGESPREIEEERRLLYVAMTRARQQLILTYANSRIRYGKIEFSKPSRFLREIDAQFLSGNLMDIPRTSPLTKSPTIAPPSPRFVSTRRLDTPTQSPAFSQTENQALQVGTRIKHERFGLGVIQELTGKGIDAKIRVLFDNVGEKQLLVRFAKFSVV